MTQITPDMFRPAATSAATGLNSRTLNDVNEPTGTGLLLTSFSQSSSFSYGFIIWLKTRYMNLIPRSFILTGITHHVRITSFTIEKWVIKPPAQYNWANTMQWCSSRCSSSNKCNNKRCNELRLSNRWWNNKWCRNVFESFGGKIFLVSSFL